MRRDLSQPVLPVELPDGVTLKAFTAVIAPACRDLLNTAYARGFGNVVPFGTWWPNLTGDSEYDPTLCFVAVREAEVVGFCQCWTSAFIKDIAVAARARGRGIGSSLVTSALRAFMARGAGAVDLKTDVDNLVAQSLYRRLGFAVVERIG